MKAHSIKPAEVVRIVHATTLFTNALIERQGCSTGLVATEGFSDVTEIGNERKYDLYDLNIERAPPLVERRMRGEISARTDATGQELTSVNAEDRKSPRLNSSHYCATRMPSSARRNT